MCAALMVHRPGSPPEEIALAGPISAGGGPADAVPVEGAAPQALALAPSPAGVIAEARAAGIVFRPGSGSPRALPPGRRRLLLPGDSLLLANAVLEAPLPPPAAAGTRVMAGRLLGDAGRGDPIAAGPHLLALEGPDSGRRLSLPAEATLGRGRGATLRLTDAGASRRHARLARAGAGFTLEDLGSKNGLRVNGAPVGRAPSALRPGDEIAFGRSVLALVLPDGSTGRGAPPGAESSAAPPAEPVAGAASHFPAGLAASLALLAAAASLAGAALGR